MRAFYKAEYSFERFPLKLHKSLLILILAHNGRKLCTVSVKYIRNTV